MDSADPILRQEPPPWLWRATGWLLVTLAAVALIVATTVPFPETVRSGFVLVSDSNAEPILAAIEGVMAECRVREGETVRRGDALVILRSETIREWRQQELTAREELRSVEEKASRLSEIHRAQLAIRQAQVVQLQREVEFRQRHLAANEEFVANMEKLEAKGALPRIEMLTHRLSLAASEKELAAARKSLEQANLELEQLRLERARQELTEHSEAEKLRIRLRTLSQRLENCEGDRLTITAPHDGVIISLPHRGDGNLVRAGEPVCQLAQSRETLKVRLDLQQSALPKLKPGQPVRLFLDAYPYQRYGTLTGRLTWITPTAVAHPTGRRFEALAEVNPAETASTVTLGVGMTGEARILVGARTLLERMLDPIKGLGEQLELGRRNGH